MTYTRLLTQLIESLRCLPGVGQKTAQRMAFHIIERNPKGGLKLAEILQTAIAGIRKCERCRNLSETSLCNLCDSTRRNPQMLCIVETPADVLAIEQTGSFTGHYFVLGGHLSPIDGIGPKELGLEHLHNRFQHGAIQEIILATNPTVEGEATAHYIAELAKQHQINTSRIAYGVPLGGELEYIDGNTLARAIEGRGKF